MITSNLARGTSSGGLERRGWKRMDISEHARKADWAEFVPAMRSKVMRFEVVDEDEWQARLNGMLFQGRA